MTTAIGLVLLGAALLAMGAAAWGIGGHVPPRPARCGAWVPHARSRTRRG